MVGNSGPYHIQRARKINQSFWPISRQTQFTWPFSQAPNRFNANCWMCVDREPESICDSHEINLIYFIEFRCAISSMDTFQAHRLPSKPESKCIRAIAIFMVLCEVTMCVSIEPIFTRPPPSPSSTLSASLWHLAAGSPSSRSQSFAYCFDVERKKASTWTARLLFSRQQSFVGFSHSKSKAFTLIVERAGCAGTRKMERKRAREKRNKNGHRTDVGKRSVIVFIFCAEIFVIRNV